MTASLPKFRSDLTILEQPTVAGPMFVVKDPATGQFFRFREAEQFIARQLDGATPIEAVRAKVESQFGAALPVETLTRFVSSLEKSGLLETDPATSKRKAKRQRRLRGSLLYLRFKLFDPDRLFNRLIGKVGLFYTPAFLVLSALFIALAAAVVVVNWEDAGQQLSRLYSISAIPIISLTIFLVITAHEFAHGLTCKRFGGEVHELGFLLIYFQPALYCNVSDAWLFPEKSKRMWVGLAGPYFELFLWALSVLIWRTTEVDTWINFIAFIVLTSSGIKTLFNLNPLIKLDGYYLLSDFLEIPNLRRKAFRYVGSRIKWLLGTALPPADPPTRRERRIYLAYGLVSTICSFSILGFALASIGNFLIQQSQPVAFALFAGLLGTKFKRRFRKLFGKPGGALDDDDDDDSDSPAASETAAQSTDESPAEQRPNGQPKTEQPRLKQPEAAPPEITAPKSLEPDVGPPATVAVNPPAVRTNGEKPKSKRRLRSSWKRAFKTLAKLTVVTGTAAAILFLGRYELKIPGQFNTLPIHNADVRAGIEGVIAEVVVDEGDLVRAGDLVARLSDRDLLAEVQKTEADVRQSRAKLKLLEAGPTDEEIDVAKTAVAKAEDRVKYAQSRRDRDRALFEQNLLSRKEYEDTQELATLSENELAESRSKLKFLEIGSRPEEQDAVRAEVARLESQRAYLEDQLRLMKVSSPAAGVVITPSRQLKEMKGQLVKKGDLIAKIVDVKTVTAEMVISEKEIADVKVGQPVLVKARAYPDETFHGKVTSIATTAQSSSGSAGQSSSSTPFVSRVSVTPKSILVTTEIDNPSLLLKPEMTGQAKILCGERRIYDLVTRRLARTVKVEFWSWW